MAVKITEDSVKIAKLKKELDDDSEENNIPTRIIGFAEIKENEYEEDNENL